jgi:hypothetical protein
MDQVPVPDNGKRHEAGTPIRSEGNGKRLPAELPGAGRNGKFKIQNPRKFQNPKSKPVTGSPGMIGRPATGRASVLALWFRPAEGDAETTRRPVSGRI